MIPFLLDPLYIYVESMGEQRFPLTAFPRS